MKIALIQCPVWGTYDPPLAMAQLSSCLKEAGHDVYVLDLNIRLYHSRSENYRQMWAWEQCSFWYSEKQVDKFFIDNNPQIEKMVGDVVATKSGLIGFSVSAASYLASIKIAKMIKQLDKSITVVFGGPLFFEKKWVGTVFKEEQIDIIIPDEGELAFTELAFCIKSGRDIRGCPGIYFKENGLPVYTGTRQPITDLDTLPFLDFQALPLTDYDDFRHIPFMASRGCIQRCAFCSSRTFWPGFRAMSGKRIFREIEFHKRQQKKSNHDFGHIDFNDLLFNGNMRYLKEFCDLMASSGMDIKWSANMIIRPEMSADVIRRMKDAGCKHIIFGIESGSQRILDLMSKHYRVEDADRVVRDMHNAGIIVTSNFMFGFPDETEDDFGLTLDFIRRNARYLDRVYPSRTYFAIEEFSYLAGHLEEFGIKPNPPNHLFWESSDGLNTYPSRLRRCSEFSELAASLGVEVGCGVQTAVELDEIFNLIQYYEIKGENNKAVDNLLRYFDIEPAHETIRAKIRQYYQKARCEGGVLPPEGDLYTRLQKAYETIIAADINCSKETVTLN
jgi:radical SAM superfamily enzyme YgiQ (UPF0313 family)